MTNLTDIQFDLTHEQAESIVVDMLKADADMLWDSYTDGDLEAGLDLDSVCDVLRYYGYEWVPSQDVSGLEIHEGSDNVFLDLGFDEEEAEKLLKQCREGWDTEEEEDIGDALFARDGLKVGDKVRVVDNTSAHRFDIGEIVEVVELEFGYYRMSNGKNFWHLVDEEVEKVT